MRRRRLIWQLLPSIALIQLVVFLMGAWLASLETRRLHYARLTEDLISRAVALGEASRDALESSRAEELAELASEVALKTQTRVTFLDARGAEIADSAPAEITGDAAQAKDVIAALKGAAGASINFDPISNDSALHVASPVMRDEEVLGVARVVMPLGAVESALKKTYAKITAGSVLLAVIGTLLALLALGGLARSLEKLQAGAERLAQGDLSEKLPVVDLGEIGAMTDAMNRMVTRLDERIRAVVRQGAERDAVLSSMVEGVLAVDSQSRIINMNDSAGRLLGVSPSEAQGRPVYEVIRNIDLRGFVTRALSSEGAIEDEIALREAGSERHMQAHGATLRDEKDGVSGALVVLNDMTRLRRLERVRRDFVANVSHELKTPVTSIKGFVETLLDGAVDNPEDARRFLGITLKQADRLNAIIEDLLMLSRLEQDEERRELTFEPVDVRKAIDAAIEACSLKSQEKSVEVEVDCPADLRAKMNLPLVEQALINLIDNAIKYSEPGRPVRVGARTDGGEVVIEVRDGGVGIASEHLPRLFERFYRADKARSRKLGGTGLGLSIVKHIAQLHGGRVGVESRLGEGSMFWIRLAKA